MPSRFHRSVPLSAWPSLWRFAWLTSFFCHRVQSSEQSRHLLAALVAFSSLKSLLQHFGHQVIVWSNLDRCQVGQRIEANFRKFWKGYHFNQKCEVCCHKRPAEGSISCQTTDRLPTKSQTWQPSLSSRRQFEVDERNSGFHTQSDRPCTYSNCNQTI